MRRILALMMASGLLAGAMGAARADDLADVTKTDKIELMKAAELRGDLARARENYVIAAGYYRTALKLDGHNAVLYNKLGIAELQMRDRNEARKHFERAVKYDPRYVAALNNLGALACLDRRYNPAVRYLKQALALNETSATSHLNLAEAWTGLGEVDRAMTEYSRALELDADILSSNPEGTVARVSTPEQKARVAYTIAKAYAKRGNLEGALEYLRRARDGHFPDLAKVYTDKTFAALWEDPRLAKIVKR